MKLYKLGIAGLIDVFYGNGWKNWTRIQVRKTKTGPIITYKKGIPLNKHLVTEIKKGL